MQVSYTLLVCAMFACMVAGADIHNPPSNKTPENASMPMRVLLGRDNHGPADISDNLSLHEQGFECEPGDKLMSYKSRRCRGHEFFACCPHPWQDAFSEDCVGLPACKYDPKNGRSERAWPGRTPNGCVSCADGYAAVSHWYGGCLEEPLPESFTNGKCRGPAGNMCL